jgi:hypothetical protein
MPTPADFKVARESRRAQRRERAERLQKWVPILEAICKKCGIQSVEIPGGYQYRANEYVLNWWPSSNKITIQYAGSGENRPFEAESSAKEPKILTALKKLIKVTKGVQASETQFSGSRQ